MTPDPSKKTTAPLDLLITGATVVHTRPQLEVIENAVIGIAGARIAFVARAADAPRTAARRTIDLGGHLVLPGFVNVHTHTILTMVRGVAEDMGFAPAYTPGVPHGHEVTPDEAVALARLGALEALMFGSTVINDSYVHADLTLPAMADVGLRAYACGRIHDVDFSRVHLGEWRHDEAIGERTLGEALALHARWHGGPEAAPACTSRRTRPTPARAACCARWRTTASATAAWSPRTCRRAAWRTSACRSATAARLASCWNRPACSALR